MRTQIELFRIGLFIHIYYDDTVLSVYRQINHLLHNNNVIVFLNISQKNPHFNRIISILQNKFSDVFIIKSTNKGKDIGGKLALLDLYLRLNLTLDYLVFLHDKKSPQLVEGGIWQTGLFNIINEENIKKIEGLFSDSKIGMIGNKENIIGKKTDPESKIFVNNKTLVFELAKQYGLKSVNYEFVGGTMFWVRESIFKKFFEEHSPLEIRKTLEPGNVMDDFGPTITHSWERLFGWIVTSHGFKIVGI